MQLMIDRMAIGYLAPLVGVEKGYGEILEIIIEKQDMILASMYVKTIIDGGVGEEMILAFRKTDTGYIITGYDRTVGDGFYINQLKPLAERYVKEGYSRADANKKAYEELYAQARQTAEEHPEWLIGG